MTNLKCRNDKSVIVHNKCSKIPPSTLVHFATRVRRSGVVRLSWSSRFVMPAAASKMRASKSSGISTLLLQASLFIQTHTIRVSYHHTTRLRMAIPPETRWNVGIRSVIVFLHSLESSGTQLHGVIYQTNHILSHTAARISKLLSVY
jgi:hypothetical protein